VIMQIPRNNRYSLPSHIPVIAVNKAKEIHSSTLKLFEKYLGETKTSLAWKKHRLVFSFANSTTWAVDEHNITLKNLANVYSGDAFHAAKFTRR